jgi:predicted nicotinamide N-methyase
MAATPCALEAAALSLADACDWRAAALAFERAAEADAASGGARCAALWEMAAQAWLEDGDASSAQAAATAATAAAPDWPEGWLTLGHALREHGSDFAGAATALRRAASLLPARDAAAAVAQAAEAEELHQLQHAAGLPMRAGVELRRLEPAAWAAGRACCAHGGSAQAGPACRVWEAGIVLARWLAGAPDNGAPQLSQRRVLDLGSGTGIAGLAAASLGAHVTLSDVADAAPLLARNVAANAAALAAAGGSARVACLDWAAPPAELAHAAPWGLLLAADCVYTAAQVAPFCALVARLTSRTRLGGPPEALLLAHKDRDAGVTAALLAALEATAPAREVPYEAHDAAYRTRSVRLFVCSPLQADA